MPTVYPRSSQFWAPNDDEPGMLDAIFSGEFQLPQFQREFVWTKPKRKALLVSILEGHPIGSILSLKINREVPQFAWTTLNNVEIPVRRIFESRETDDFEPPLELILDGQQRCTTLARIFSWSEEENWCLRLKKDDDHPNSLYHRFLNYLEDEERTPPNGIIDQWLDTEIDLEKVVYAGTARAGAEAIVNRFNPKRMILPLQFLVNEDTWRIQSDDLNNRIDQSRNRLLVQYRRAVDRGNVPLQQENQEEMKDLQMFNRFKETVIARIGQRVGNYSVPVVLIPRSMPIAGVCKVFTTLNTTAVKLSAFDLCVAKLYPSEIRLKDMWDRAKTEYPLIEILDNPIVILASIALHQGLTPKTAKLPDVITPELIQDHWDAACQSVQVALKHLDSICGAGITGGSTSYLAYEPMVAPFSAMIRNSPLPEGDSREDIQRAADYKNRMKAWYYTSAVVGRYGQGTDSKQTQDFANMSAWFGRVGGNWFDNSPTWMTESGAQPWNMMGAMYKSTLSMLNSHHPRDWMSNDEIVGYGSHATNSDLHHVFPRAFMMRIIRAEHRCDETEALKRFRNSDFSGGQGYAGNTVMNKVWLKDSTNRNYINDQEPSIYLVKMIEQHGEEKMRELLAQQGINDEGFDAMLNDNYKLFIEQRVQRINEMMQSANNFADSNHVRDEEE